ncbi:alpha/beta fold hydrolase [Leeuwenhoekiella parthenopeia]|uniref:Alpha/beta hydrolase n=1 Tax=Leeuwenhoekiella parthenopeia TaxID=2890320 RepID=A0ABS8GUX3_9FLAO|nr:alpha/beta hydrolase [Leeuwenhoekiella parthenopeia]MCC4213812.1 alpha/beta hydrolase [Leeuwenhoekiella parthenopeia]
MSYFKTSSIENRENIKLYYEDYGTGDPVILIHGWPLSAQMWEYQTQVLVEAGHRVIAFDRRGFGRSDKPWSGYDYDTLAKDLNDLITGLDLENVTIVGFSMGGGEVSRYIGNYGTSKLKKAALVSSVAAFMLKTDDNPDGVPQETFDGFKAAVRKDRLAFLKDFGNNFVNYDDNKDKISEAQVHFNWSIAAGASPKGTLDCITSFGTTDFRADLEKFDIPTLIIHGDADQVVPIKPSGEQAASIVKGSRYEVIKGAPHGLVFTHTEEVNKILIDFLKD